MGPTKGPNEFSTYLNPYSWDLNLAGRWGSVNVELEQGVPRGFEPCI